MKRNSYQSAFFFLFLLIVHCSLLSALDIVFRPKGFAYIPMGTGNSAADGNARYSAGGGGDIGLELDLSTVWPNPLGIGYTAGIEGGLIFNEIKSDPPKTLSTYSLGGGLGLYYFPLSRLLVRADGALGVYIPNLEGKNGSPSMYLRGGGEIGFRFTPLFTLAANIGWRQYQRIDNSIFNSGVYAGLTAQITFQTGNNNSGEGVIASLDQYEPVYPVFTRLYQTNAIGNIVIRNNENAEIRDARVSFRASGYTASEFPCGEAAIIPRGRKMELPLLANFSPEILRFTDNGRILGELVIRYHFLGQEREAVRTVIVETHNRNRTTGDIAALAAFISPTSPEMLDYAKYISGLARTNRRTGHNRNFQYALWLFEGLRASGIMLGETYSADNEAQFPAETLVYGTGNSRDLALLFASGLEGVGIPSAFIAVENDFLAAVGLSVNKSAAETLFNGTDKILIINDTVWVPLLMSALGEGFSAAWTKGVEVLRQAFTEGKEADFVMVEEAWAIYPPAPFPEQGNRAIRADTASLTREVNRAMQQYIDQEITTVLRQLQSQINTGPTMALYNRMGIVLARAGRMTEAKTNYERAAGMGSVPAMTNRGNLALIENDFATAERFFRQALSRDSENKAAIKGLEQIAERR